MAAGIVQISDVIVPEIFTPYTQLETERKSRLIQSRAVATDPAISALLAGAGLTFNVPSWKDLDDDEERTSTDTIPARYTGGTADPDPNKVGTVDEIAVRLSRNNSWGTSDLVQVLAGSDPAQAIANRVAAYWVRRQQKLFLATMTGIFADNAAAPSGVDTHVQNDMTLDIKGAAFSNGVTNFSAEAFLDAAQTMGDSQESLAMVMIHSIVYNRMLKNNLIDFLPDSEGKPTIPTFLGREVIVDDGMPYSGGIAETWLFGPGALRLGTGAPAVPTEVERHGGAGNGGGAETLYNRVEWCLHPVGHRYIGTAPKGGPTNAATSNNLANAGSWARVYPERKSIKIARLITREA